MDTPVTTFSEAPDDPFAVRRSASAVLDGNGRVVGWSERAEALLGYAAEDVLGRPVREVMLDPRDEEVVMAAVAACLSAGGWFGIIPVRDRGGKRVELGCRVRAVARADGGIEWFLVGGPAEQVIQWETDRSILDGMFRRSPIIVVPLVARGLVLGVVSLWRWRRPEPFEEDDLTLAEEFAARAAVCIDNARRYTQQHQAALALQRSLLPSEVPEHPAVEIDHRYLPADATVGVGGDWFDVVPLSGLRVALVVGDVVGHGIHAAATMGRLRTAVHTLAHLDLPPDEVLSHLDDLVDRLAGEQEATGERAPQVVGATCLYAVYDPVSGRCALARAGHPPPAVVTPDGRVAFPDLPAGPPLGLGGLPFEAAELELPEGSLLALYTDGLLAVRRRDVDEGLELLRGALSDPVRSLEDTCKAVEDALLPDRPGDDIALLTARPRCPAAHKVATWELPAEPTAAAEGRTLAVAQLNDWGLEEVAFTTELIVSELITNAYRYSCGPVTLRLIRDRHLICEVSDPSSTSPHLRHAATTDGGGRGLFLIAQLTERWGTRYVRNGKTIWTEQPLP